MGSEMCIRDRAKGGKGDQWRPTGTNMKTNGDPWGPMETKKGANGGKGTPMGTNGNSVANGQHLCKMDNYGDQCLSAIYNRRRHLTYS